MNTAIREDIFNKFKFKDLSKSSKPNKIYMEVINTYFKCEVFQSKFNPETKQTKFLMNKGIDFNELKTTLNKFLIPKLI